MQHLMRSLSIQKNLMATFPKRNLLPMAGANRYQRSMSTNPPELRPDLSRARIRDEIRSGQPTYRDGIAWLSQGVG